MSCYYPISAYIAFERAFQPFLLNVVKKMGVVLDGVCTCLAIHEQLLLAVAASVDYFVGVMLGVPWHQDSMYAAWRYQSILCYWRT